MALRGHGLAIAITAVVTFGVASAGTAVAVTSSVVTIADPSDLSRQAHVDTAGRLTVTPPTATIDASGLTNVGGDTFISSPTAATLAITKISFSHPSVNAAASSAEVRFYLYRAVVTGGACTSNLVGGVLGIYNIAPGDDFEDVFDTPLVVAPLGSAKFCLDLITQTLGGTYNASYLPSYNVAAYVVSGKYTPVGAAAPADSPAGIAGKEKAATR